MLKVETVRISEKGEETFYTEQLALDEQDPRSLSKASLQGDRK
jgi:hypothetical protein